MSALLSGPDRQTGLSPRGARTGLSLLDEKLRGLRPGGLYIVAGRPGMAKTSLAMNIAANAARARDHHEAGGGVAIFALAASGEALTQRIVASEARVELGRVRSRQLSDDEQARFEAAAGEVARMAIHIDDRPAAAADLPDAVRRLQAASPPPGGPCSAPLVMVDDLQHLVRASGDGTTWSVCQQVSAQLRALAWDLDLPVLVLSQVPGDPSGRPDLRPRLDDLEEYGAAVAQADAVVFVYRDEYFHFESPDRGRAELIVAKNRWGPLGPVQVRFDTHHLRFDDLHSLDLMGG